MKINEYLAFLTQVEKLKSITRHSWTSDGTHETVAAHSWRLSLMAMMSASEFKDLDMMKVIKMCIVHDLGESITTDIPSFEKTAEDEALERVAQNQLIAMVSGDFQEELKQLFEEMNEMKSKEALLYKCFDKLEVLIQHNEASLDTWIDLEKELQLVYGEEECETFEFTKQLRNQIKEDTIRKLRDK